MKHIFYIFAGLLMTAQTLNAQIIYRPGPGANDSTDQGGLTGGKDAWVFEETPTTNYGDQTYIEAMAISNCNNTRCIGYIQFDVSTLPAAVDSAFVVYKHIPYTSYCYSGCVADFYFARITQPWYEMTINYSNKPTFDTAFYGPINITFPNDFGVRQYDITGTYLLWKSGAVPNYGMAIYSPTVNCNNAAVFFGVYSSDDTAITDRPYLKIYPHPMEVGNMAASHLNFNLYPNPATNQADMEFTLDGTQNVRCLVMDFTGRVVYRKETELQGGFNRISVPLGDLTQGLYIYSLTTKQGRVAGKLVKQ